MGFVIELKHKPPSSRTMYVCAVPVGQHDYKNTSVHTLAEARGFPYPTAEVAAAVVASFPPTKNIIYSVIEVDATQAQGAKAGQ